jgi:hypothetical protein
MGGVIAHHLGPAGAGLAVADIDVERAGEAATAISKSTCCELQLHICKEGTNAAGAECGLHSDTFGGDSDLRRWGLTLAEAGAVNKVRPS